MSVGANGRVGRFSLLHAVFLSMGQDCTHHHNSALKSPQMLLELCNSTFLEEPGDRSGRWARIGALQFLTAFRYLVDNQFLILHGQRQHWESKGRERRTV